jgi:hypothetical protein
VSLPRQLYLDFGCFAALFRGAEFLSAASLASRSDLIRALSRRRPRRVLGPHFLAFLCFLLRSGSTDLGAGDHGRVAWLCRQPRTLASMASLVSVFRQQPSVHWQRNGRTYVPTWSSQRSSTGVTQGGITIRNKLVEAFRSCGHKHPLRQRTRRIVTIGPSGISPFSWRLPTIVGTT